MRLAKSVFVWRKNDNLKLGPVLLLYDSALALHLAGTNRRRLFVFFFLRKVPTWEHEWLGSPDDSTAYETKNNTDFAI